MLLEETYGKFIHVKPHNGDDGIVDNKQTTE